MWWARTIRPASRPKTEKDTVPFTPYATIKDGFGVACFLLFYAWFIFYMPNYLGDADNYIPANPGVTPPHIVPEWYYLPFYAILRSIPNKLAGVIAMFSAIIVLVFLPWLDSAKTRSSKYRPLAKQFFWIFVVVCVLLGYLGAQPPEGIYVIAGRILTVCYFAYFLVVLPLLSRIETPRKVPNSIADDVLAKYGSKSGGKAVASIAVAFAVAGALFAGSTQTARAERTKSRRPRSGRSRGRSASMTVAPCSGASRSTRKSAPTATRCPTSPFAISPMLAAPAIPRRRSRRSLRNTRSRTVRTTRAKCSNGRAGAADYFPSPFPNEQAARVSNGGAAPPDLSLIAKARSYERGFPRFIFDFFTQYQEQGPDYVACPAAGLRRRPAGRRDHPRRLVLQQVFPGSRHQDAEAAQRRPGDLRRRLAGHRGAICQGRDDLPDVDRGAAAWKPASGSGSRSSSS